MFNLRVAARARGRGARVWLMPDPGEPDLAATVSLEQAAALAAGVVALAGAIPRRHTNRRPFEDRPVPPAVVDELHRGRGRGERDAAGHRPGAA